MARTSAGLWLTVEGCEPGAGNVALTTSLLPDGRPPLADLVSNGTRYRRHGCRGKAIADFLKFGAAAFGAAVDRP